MAKKKRGCISWFFIFGLFVIGLGAVVFFYANQFALKDNVKSDQLKTELLIPKGATFNQVVDSLMQNDILIHEASFRQVAQLKGYDKAVKAGRFLIKHDWNNLQLVNYLRSGNQAPVRLVINNVRTKEELAGKIASQIELDSLTILNQLHNPEVAKEYGFDSDTFPAMFLANTYEVYWNLSEENLLKRMNKEYKRFWNKERLAKAEALNLTPVDAIILASIVEEETKAKSEMATVAGLYLNRLKKGMKLESDPTVKYAMGDFSIRRVLNKHLKKESPYNTYMNVGLPPGPIRIPELTTVKAVLNPEKHSYIFMCAKPDFSGKHAFAETLREHNNNANRYRKALNTKGIY